MYHLLVGKVDGLSPYERQVTLVHRWGETSTTNVATADGLNWERLINELVDRLAVGMAVIDGDLHFFNVTTNNEYVVARYSRELVIMIFKAVCDIYDMYVRHVYVQD